MKRGEKSSAKQKATKAMSTLYSCSFILAVQGNHSKTGFFVYSLLVTVVALNKVHQFKVGVDSLDGAGVGIADNVVSVFILTEVNGKAIGFIGALVSPIGRSDGGLRSGEWLRK